jgi:sulfoxide reductase heme-binding subunit YedZ
VLAVGSEALWYLTRGTGLVSMLLLTTVVVLGIAQVHRWATEGWPQLVVAGLHKNASLLVVVFLGIHIVSTVVDGFAPIDWIDAVIPFTSAYRPLWLGLGALAFDLLLAVTITSLLRRHLRYRAWRAVHWLAYACWPIAFVHGLGTGSDGSTSWVLAIDAACLATVVGAVAWRIIAARDAPTGRRLGAGVLTGSATMLILTWALAGPMSASWARRAGTPTDLLATGGESTTTLVPATATGFAPPFTTALSGSLTEPAAVAGVSHLTIDGTLRGDADGRLHLEVTGPLTTSGSIRLQSSQISLGPDDEPNRYTGQVTAWRGSSLTATARDQTNHTVTVTITLQLDRNLGTASGTVTTTRPKPGG